MLTLTLVAGLLVSPSAVAEPQAEGKRPAPVFTDVSVHDPDLIRVDGTYYAFGSHLAAASSPDLKKWTSIADGVTPDNPLFDDVTTELKETLDWAQSTTLWAPDVIRLGDGKFYMYYDACKGDSPRSALGLAVADKVTGPYKDLGILLKSGMWDLPSEDGTIYDPLVHPNTVDPDVFFDAQGKLWMIYGSFSGGIFILGLDPSTGKPFPGQGYGKHLMGGNHSRIEGPAVMYNPETKYYYLFTTFGGLDANGGYNIRVARSRHADGPYRDAAGTDMATVKSDPSLPLFDDASIAPYGTKLMGNYEFSRRVGDPGSGAGVGYVSPGGTSPVYDAATGRQFLAFHTRFPGRGEDHQVRVHQMYTNADGWPVIAPYRYAGKSRKVVARSDMVGTYAYVNHGKAISADVTAATELRLRVGGTVTGAVRGTWKKVGRNGALLTLGGQRYTTVFSRQWEPDSQRWVVTFSGLSKAGVSVWGSKRRLVSHREVVRRVVADLTLPETAIANLTLPTVGTQASTLTWSSNNAAVISATGVVTRPAAGSPDALVQLKATVTSGPAKKTTTLTVKVPARPVGGVVASYAFDGSLASNGTAAAGIVSGNKIGVEGGSISYAEGVHGQAAVFDGGSGVRLPDGLISGSSYAVSLWLKPQQLTALSTTFFGAKDNNSWVSLLPKGHDGVQGNTMVWSGTAWFDGNTGTQIPAGEWSHVALSNEDGHLVVWINGAKVLDQTGFPDVFTTTTGTFSLGVNWWDAPYQGAMDDVAIYNTPLTDAQVAELAK
ncbi:MAG: family 43 glycosylhydrolase, partial [Propionibacteriaceae bacterium]